MLHCNYLENRMPYIAYTSSFVFKYYIEGYGTIYRFSKKAAILDKIFEEKQLEFLKDWNLKYENNS